MNDPILEAWEREHPGQDWRTHEARVTTEMERAIAGHLGGRGVSMCVDILPVVEAAPVRADALCLVPVVPPVRSFPRDPLVSISEACQQAGVSRRTIYDWIHSGRLEYVRTAGGAIRIRAGSLFRPVADLAS